MISSGVQTTTWAVAPSTTGLARTLLLTYIYSLKLLYRYQIFTSAAIVRIRPYPYNIHQTSRYYTILTLAMIIPFLHIWHSPQLEDRQLHGKNKLVILQEVCFGIED